MKRLILIITILNSIAHLSGQEIGFYTTYSGSSYKKYQNNIGLGIEYNHFIKSKNRFGIAVQYSFCKTNYSHIYSSTADGHSLFIEKFEPNNQRLALKTNFVFKIINNPKSSLFLGPEIGINYFFINENVRRLESEYVQAAEYKSKGSVNNKIGFGFLIEFELKEIISKQLSLFSSIHPEIIGYETYGMLGGYDPYFIGWLNFNLGIKYNFHKD